MTTNGTGLPDPSFAGLEDALRAPVAEVKEAAQSGTRLPAPRDLDIDHNTAANNADDVVHDCMQMAATVRGIIAQRREAYELLCDVGEKFAADCENRARMFSEAVKLEIEDVRRARAIFEDEHAKLRDFGKVS